MILFLQVANLSNTILHEHRATNIFHYIRSSVAFLCVGVSAVGTHLKYVSMRHSFTEITQKLELELRRAAFRSRRDCRHIDYVTDARGNKDRRALQSWSTSLARGNGQPSYTVTSVESSRRSVQEPGVGVWWWWRTCRQQARARASSRCAGAAGARIGSARRGAPAARSRGRWPHAAPVRGARCGALHCTVHWALSSGLGPRPGRGRSRNGCGARVAVHTCALRGAPVGTARRAAARSSPRRRAPDRLRWPITFHDFYIIST